MLGEWKLLHLKETFLSKTTLGVCKNATLTSACLILAHDFFNHVLLEVTAV